MDYEWKRGARGLLGHECQPVAEQICSILKKHGELTPDIIKESAKRAKKSPLGKTFKWDRDAAAEAYWHTWAGYILRSITYRPESVDDEDDPIRCYFVMRYEEEETDKDGKKTTHVTRSYEPLDDILTDEELRAQLLENALEELRAFRKKYKELRELANVFSVIDAL